MPRIRSAAEIAEKWARVTPGRSTDYAEGIANPKRDWAGATAAAEDSWAQGVQNAVGNKLFSKGVQKAGTAKWQENAQTKGAARWGPGVSGAQSSYESGFAPYVQEIQSITLPPRGPKGDPRNIERVARIATALHARKMRG